MYRLNRTARILLAALVGAVVTSASMSAASVFLRARSLVDNRFTAATRLFEYAAPGTRERTASVRDVAVPTRAIDMDGGDTAESASQCGGLGQRACCFLENTDIGECQTGLKAVDGCFGDCLCPGILHVDSLGTCMPVQSCGGAGQRACQFAERPFKPCDEGLREVRGCSGDCYAQGLPANSMCSKLGSIENEPGIDALTLDTPACPLYGYMDMHLHLFADMAHGGAVLAGKPAGYSCTTNAAGTETCVDHGINEALKQDFTTNADLVLGDGSPSGTWDDAKFQVTANPDTNRLAYEFQKLAAFVSGLITLLTPCPVGLLGSACDTQDYFHGPHDPLLGDSVGSMLGTQDGATSNFGAPLFNGWPKWTSTTHQQTYYRWLERAWRGGLRMVTMLAVTNEALCRGGKHNAGVVCGDSMKSIDEQIKEAYRFQTFIDGQHGGDGWFRIVTTPLQARQVIAQGKLAVVLGIETAELFNCYDPVTSGKTECTEDFINGEVDRYYAMGVRHVFPVHNFDNAFGAAATWQDGIEVGQRLVEGDWWVTDQTDQCAQDGYRFKLGYDTQRMITLLKFTRELGDDKPPERLEFSSCNAKGLRWLGHVLIDKLMAKGMIIDVDHMSIKAFNETLEQAENHAGGPYAGIVASHVLSFDLQDPTVRHERLRKMDQLKRIKNVGGMIAAMLKDDGQDTGRKGQKLTLDFGSIANNCRHSSKTFANAYQYAVEQMGGPVALGSDFNGVAGHIGPRFGSEGCGGNFSFNPFASDAEGQYFERLQQYFDNNRLSYPFTLDGFGTFTRQTTGERTFDYNYDGMAHIGLLPDFVADLKTIGMPEDDLNMLFRSAEAYVRMWEKATGETPPVNAQSCATITGITGWPTPVYTHRTVYFSPTGTPGVGGMKFVWNFGDGGTSTDAYPTHAYVSPLTYNVTATITDPLFGTSSIATTTINVLDGADAPEVRLTLGGPAEVFEGDTVPLRIGFNLTPWVIDQTPAATKCGDGSQRTALFPTTDINDVFTWRAEYEMRCKYLGGPQRTATAQVQVFDSILAPFGLGERHTQTHQVLVKNRPPEFVNLPSSISTTWPNKAVLPVSVRDAEGETVRVLVESSLGIFSNTVVLTDQPSLITKEFLYDKPSHPNTPYRLRVLATDDDGATAERFVDVNVVGARPTLTLSGPTRTGVGTTARYHVTKNDPDGGPVDLTSFDCGAAGELLTPLTETATDFDCKFNVPLAGNLVSVSAIDDDGQTRTTAAAVTIGTPPGGSINGTVTTNEGSVIEVLLKSVSTDGDPVSVTHNCGDGTFVSLVIFDSDPNLWWVLTCRFPDGPVTQPIRATFADIDGEFTVTRMPTVNNLPPSLTLTPPATILQRQPANVTLLFGDAGLDDVTVVINWGDGSSDTRSGGRENPPLTLQHTWAAAGPHTITAIATDSDGAATTTTVNVSVGDTTPPVVTITAPTTTVEATSPAGAPVTFTATATDNVDLTVTTSCSPVSGSTFPMGTTTVTCMATDSSGNTGKSSIVVTVRDTTPPSVICRVDTMNLWPPNHRLIPVQAQVTISDSASGVPGGFILRNVTSNEPDNGLGDGDTENDIQGWALATPDTSGMFRAERSGNGAGRIYTLTYQAVDRAGNVGTCTTTVSVVNDTAGKK